MVAPDTDLIFYTVFLAGYRISGTTLEKKRSPLMHEDDILNENLYVEAHM